MSLGSTPEKYLGELASPSHEEEREPTKNIRKQEELPIITLKNNIEMRNEKVQRRDRVNRERENAERRDLLEGL